jgi:hypothetical protein
MHNSSELAMKRRDRAAAATSVASKSARFSRTWRNVFGEVLNAIVSWIRLYARLRCEIVVTKIVLSAIEQLRNRAIARAVHDAR